MAYSLISANNKQAEGASPQTATYANTPAVGSLLIAFVKRNSQSGTPTVTDGNSNNFSLLQTENYNGTSSQTLLFAMLAGFSQSTAITVTGTGTYFLDIYEFDYSGGALPSIQNILDVIAATNDGGTVGTTTSGGQPSVTTNNAADLVFTGVGTSSTVTSPSFTNATLLQSNASGLIQQFDAYQIETSTGTYTPYASWTTSRNWGQITGAFLPGASSYPKVLQAPWGATDNSASTMSGSPGSNVTAGSDILVIINWYRSSGAYPNVAVTDSAGNTYTQITGALYNGSSILGPSTVVFQAHNVSGLTTAQSVTATFSGGAGAPFGTMLCLEVSNLSTNLDGSVVSGQGGSGTSISFSGLTTSANQNDFVLVAIGSFGNLTATKWSAGWSLNGFQSASPTTSIAWANIIASTAISGTATLAASELWDYLIIAIKAAGGGGNTGPIGKDIGNVNNNFGAYVLQSVNRSSIF